MKTASCFESATNSAYAASFVSARVKRPANPAGSDGLSPSLTRAIS
jgi:hypothetical protein